jgi:GH15 family glucan-1,4-alpha-glucosidase
VPRDLPIGNGKLLVNFDGSHVLRDLYYPFVGKENHAGGFPFRFGVFVDGRFSWLGSEWRIDRRYEADTLVTQVTAEHDGLGLRLRFSDCVDFHETLLLRRLEIENLRTQARDVKVYFHQDFRISESDVGDTAFYEPQTRTVTHYKGFRYFLVNLAVDGEAGISEFAIGQKGAPGRDGTWRDAEDDGNLGKNPIAQGAVDSVVSAAVKLGGEARKVVHYWMVVGQRWDGTWDAVKSVNAKVVQRGAESFIERTRAYWRLWVRKEPNDYFDLTPGLIDLYRRSLLILRTQIDENGGIVAANDSDITQFARDTYSYVWPRDGALVARALDLAGHAELPVRFFTFCADVLQTDGYLLHKYNPDRSLASSWHPWIQGGKQQLPIQEDETALCVWALWKHFVQFRDLESVKPLYGRLVKRAADFMVRYRNAETGLPLPSYDLWEERRGILTFTCAAVHGGLRAAAEFARIFGENEPATRYARAAAEVRAGMDRHLYRPELGRFARMINVTDDGSVVVDPVIDASMYGLFAFEAYPADDPRVEATMRAIRERLWIKTAVGGVARYEDDYYHQQSKDVAAVPGNPWFICTLWLAQYHIACARSIEELRPAIEILEWVDKHKLPSGVLAEQVHPYTNAPLSVSPLTWSHATVVTVVEEYLAKRASLDRCKTCGSPLSGTAHGEYHLGEIQALAQANAVRTSSG